MTAYQVLGDRLVAWRDKRSRRVAAAALSVELGYPVQRQQLERVERGELTERSAVVRVLARHFGVELPGVVR